MESDQAFAELAAINRKHMRLEADEEKAQQALKLIERAALMPAKMAWAIRESGYMTGTQKLERAMQLLPHLLAFADDVEAPDNEWWHDYYVLTGVHVILSDEGWEPGENKEYYLADDPTWEPIDELNAPPEPT